MAFKKGIERRETEFVSLIDIIFLLLIFFLVSTGLGQRMTYVQEFLAISIPKVEVKPKLIVTVTYQNIQKSPKYSSGFALRFPRFTRLRLDRGLHDIAFLHEIKREYKK